MALQAPPMDVGPNAAQRSQSIIRAANTLGVDPLDLARAISIETIGTFDPAIKGGTKGDYVGLIQFGPVSSKDPTTSYNKYNVSAYLDDFDAQLNGPVVQYLQDRGLKSGMGLGELYSIINAGSLKDGKPRWGASDGNGSVRSKVAQMLRGDWDQGPVVDLAKTYTGTIAKGSPPEVVKSLQSALVAAGYDVGPTGADGKFGPATMAAVKAFQADKGLPTTGLTALSFVTNPPTTAAAATPPETRSPGHIVDDSIREARIGEDFKAIQEDLKARGYYSGPIDGKATPEFWTALTASTADMPPPAGMGLDQYVNASPRPASGAVEAPVSPPLPLSLPPKPPENIPLATPAVRQPPPDEMFPQPAPLPGEPMPITPQNPPPATPKQDEGPDTFGFRALLDSVQRGDTDTYSKVASANQGALLGAKVFNQQSIVDAFNKAASGLTMGQVANLKANFDAGGFSDATPFLLRSGLTDAISKIATINPETGRPTFPMATPPTPTPRPTPQQGSSSSSPASFPAGPQRLQEAEQQRTFSIPAASTQGYVNASPRPPAPPSTATFDAEVGKTGKTAQQFQQAFDPEAVDTKNYEEATGGDKIPTMEDFLAASPFSLQNQIKAPTAAAATPEITVRPKTSVVPNVRPPATKIPTPTPRPTTFGGPTASAGLPRTPSGDFSYQTSPLANGGVMTTWTDKSGNQQVVRTNPDGTSDIIQGGSSSSASGGGTVLCTHYHRRGWLPRDVWHADLLVSRTYDREAVLGYYSWAMPLLRVIKRGGWRGRVVEWAAWPIVRAWAYEVVWLAGFDVPRPRFGWLVKRVLEPWSRWLGVRLTREWHDDLELGSLRTEVSHLRTRQGEGGSARSR